VQPPNSEQHALEALDRGLGVLQLEHHEDERARHPLEQLALLRGEAGAMNVSRK
jgi:hypothetical protein